MSDDLVFVMINYHFYSEWKLHHVRAEETCSLLGLVEYGVELSKSAGPQADLDQPALFDLRGIDLTTDTTASIKKAIRLRKSIKAKTGGNPCAYVMGSRGSFGMMRMYGIYAELEGLRKEEMTLVTLCMNEAVEWLIARSELSEQAVAAMRDALAERGAA